MELQNGYLINYYLIYLTYIITNLIDIQIDYWHCIHFEKAIRLILCARMFSFLLLFVFIILLFRYKRMGYK